MKHFLIISSYVFVAALGAVFALAIHRGGDLGDFEVTSHSVSFGDQSITTPVSCTPVIISEFGDQALYLDKVCSNEDLARIYGETRLREQEWTSQHDCDVDTGDAPSMMKMRWER